MGARLRTRLHGRRCVALLLVGATLVGCDVHDLSSPGALATITMAPNTTLLATSDQQMVAVGRDADGRVVTIAPTWSVVALGGTINVTGLFVAGRVAGVFVNTVVATVGSLSASATVTVLPGPVAAITVVPGTITMAVTSKQQFTAVAKDASGNVEPFLPTWSIVAGGGTIDSAGNFAAGGTPGIFTNTVQASNDGITSFATVTVMAGPLATIAVTPNPDTVIAGGKQRFTAPGKDASGNSVPVAVVWSIAANGGTIDQAGLFTAGTVLGTFTNTIRATSGALGATATVVVIAGPLAALTVSPNPVSIQTNDTQQFVAVGRDAGGNGLLIIPVWSVENGGGTIDRQTGLFTAGTTAGMFPNTIRATIGAISGSATVTVTSPPVVGVISSFEDFAIGAIDGQFDWQSFGGAGAAPPANPLNTHCAVYDQVIADNTAAASAYSYPSFGAKSLRISNAVTSGCYTDQTFSNRTANPAGHAGARSTSPDGSVDYALPGGVVQNHFEAAWSFASTVPNAEQPGLQVVASPARGDDLRMGWVQMSDLPDGLAVTFGEWTSTVPGGTTATGAPRLTMVARGLDRHVPHTLELTMDFLDGPNNDVVQLFVDGVLKYTGTSWENYYVYDSGHAKFGGATPIVNRLMFRTGSDLGRGIAAPPAPAAQGHGFVIDNLRQATFMVGTAALLFRHCCDALDLDFRSGAH